MSDNAGIQEALFAVDIAARMRPCREGRRNDD
jgi:hypothetical protein